MAKHIAGWMAIAIALGMQSAAIAVPMEATTSDGKTVILNDDGTWNYQRLTGTSSAGSDRVSSRPAGATESISSSKGFVDLWFDPDAWTVDAENDNDAAEFGLSHVSGDAYALVIVERLSMPMSALKQVALSNASKVSDDIEIVREESRTINDIEMMVMQLEGTIQEIPFTFYGAYWVGDAGSLQVVTYTGQNLFEEFEPDMTTLLEGIDITES